LRFLTCSRDAFSLKTPHDIHVVIHYEEAHKNRARVVSAAQTRLADIAQEVVGIST